MAQKVNDVKAKRSEVLYYRMLIVLSALIAAVFSINYFTSRPEMYNTFTFRTAPIISLIFVAISIPLAVYFAVMRKKGVSEQFSVFSSGYLLTFALWLASIFGLNYFLSTKKLFAYIVVTAALYFLYYLFCREFFVFSVYAAFGAAVLVFMNTAGAVGRIVCVLAALLASVAVIALVLADKKKAVVLTVGKSKMSLTDGSFKAYPFCIAAGIVLAGMILSFFIGGAAFYSLIVLFAYYLVFTIVNTIKMM